MNNDKNKATKQFPIVSISRDFLREIHDPQEDPKAHNRVESLTDEDMRNLAREMKFPCTPNSFVDILQDLFESMFMVGETEEKSKPICPQCGKEINSLDWRSQLPATSFSIDNDGDPDYHDFQVSISDTEVSFNCPICNETLFTNEEEATAFLKGKIKQ